MGLITLPTRAATQQRCMMVSVGSVSPLCVHQKFRLQMLALAWLFLMPAAQTHAYLTSRRPSLNAHRPCRLLTSLVNLMILVRWLMAPFLPPRLHLLTSLRVSRKAHLLCPPALLTLEKGVLALLTHLPVGDDAPGPVYRSKPDHNVDIAPKHLGHLGLLPCLRQNGPG